MKLTLLALLAALFAAASTSCTVLVNDDGSKSVIVDPEQVAKALGSKSVTLNDDGKIVATK